MWRKKKARRVPRAGLVIAACLGILGGIGWAHLSPLSDARWLTLLALPALMSLRRHNLFTLIWVTALCVGVGWWRGSVYLHRLNAYHSLFYQKVTLIGRASEDGVYGKRYQLTFNLKDVRATGLRPQQLVGEVSVGGFGAPAVYRGDIVMVAGKLYPTRGSQQARISFGQLTVLARNTSAIDALRRRFAAGMQSALPEPLASFAMGLLVGQRSTLPPEISQQLLAVGLTHIIAVSGYNLTIILRATRRMLGNRSKFQATLVCVGLTTLFLLFTGSSPSIVRASIISMLSIAAWYFGRTIKPLVLLLVAAAMTALANPLYVWGNVSWYLSFLAFFGVLVMAPLLARRLVRGGEPKLLALVVIESFCAEIMTLPYILHVFGQFSTVGLLANVLVVALVPLAMLLSLVAGLAGMLVPVFAGWVAFPAQLLLIYMLDIARLLSRLPHSFIEHLSFSVRAMLAGYGCLLFVIAVWWDKKRQKDAIITEKMTAET